MTDGKLMNFKIRVHGSDIVPVFDDSDENLCHYEAGVVADEAEVFFPCSQPLLGRHVSVQSSYDNAVLSLCEVEIYGTSKSGANRCMYIACQVLM